MPFYSPIFNKRYYCSAGEYNCESNNSSKQFVIAHIKILYNGLFSRQKTAI